MRRIARVVVGGTLFAVLLLAFASSRVFGHDSSGAADEGTEAPLIRTGDPAFIGIILPMSIVTLALVRALEKSS